MTDRERGQTPARVRREPPRFRRVSVRDVKRLGARMIRVTLAGPELEGFTAPDPAASVRLLLPPAGTRELEMPAWNGNEFLLPSGRPRIRTFTPRRVDAEALALDLDLDIVVHEGGAASAWVAAAERGDEAAVSGPGRGYAIDPGARSFLLAGDETAIPAISQLLEALPGNASVQVSIEVAEPDGRLELPSAAAVVAWCDLPAGAPPGGALVAAVRAAELPAGTQVWVAGEAAAVQGIRRHLFEERGLKRTSAHVRGYWKRGRSGEADDG